jgi:hypothetical protein
MAVTQNTYTGNGSTTLYSLSFSYLEQADVKVTINGTPTTAFIFVNTSTIQFLSAPANGATILIYRSTDDASLSNTFFAGTSIKAQDLNDNFLQSLYISQETATLASNQSTAGLQAQITAATNTADNATVTANAASVTANGIASTANSALSAANSAVSTANTAATNATTAVNTADAAQITANAAMPKTGGTFTGDISVPSINGGPISGARNRIINGDMRIDQKNFPTAVTPTNGSYTLDRWSGNVTQASKFTVQQNAGAVTPPAGFTNYLGVVSSSAYSITSSDAFSIYQAIEGLNSADLAWGTADAQPVVLSFWVRSSLAGTFGGSLKNSAGNRSYPFSYTISSANTWERKTVAVLGDTSGTWLSNNSTGILLTFGFGVGTTFSGTAGAWAGTNLISATGATSVVGTNGATFYITGVQLEAGTVATPFERRSYGQELALCQRYYIAETLPAIRYGRDVASSRLSTVWVDFPVTMRATPTTTQVTSGSVGTQTVSASNRSLTVSASASAGDMAALQSYTASIEL